MVPGSRSHGSRLRPINYHPISLTSITCKMLEHILTSNIMQHLDTHNILHDAQYGFRKHRSTETHLIQLIDNLAHNIDNKIQTDAILLDFQKAFDKVPHQRLLYKLKYYGISPQALNWVHSFLTNRTQQVLLEGNMSSSINVTSGVPQGSVLGPILFLIYINDFPDYIQNNSTVKLFADDTIIYHPITNQQDSNALQEDLDALQRWESDWFMHFHLQKRQTMHITNKHHPIHLHHTQPQPPNNQRSQIPRYMYPHPQHPKLEHSHQQDCPQSKHNFSLPPQKHSHMPTQNQTPSLHNTSTSHLRIWQHHLGSTYSLQHPQT